MPSHTQAEQAKRQAEKEAKVGSFITKPPTLAPNPTAPVKPSTPVERRRAEEKAAGIVRKPTEKQEKLKRFLGIFGIKF